MTNKKSVKTKLLCALSSSAMILSLFAVPIRVSAESENTQQPKVYENGNNTLDLQGDFTADGDDGAIWVKNGAQLTINGTDNDKVHATLGAYDYSMAVWAKDDGSKVIINGGSYSNETDGSERGTDLIYASGGATIEINGGTFKAAKTEWTLNCKDNSTSTITVKGGSFYKFDPSNNKVSPTGRTEIVIPDEYKVVQDGDWYKVVGKEKVVSNGKEYASLKSAIDANKDKESANLELHNTVTWFTGATHGSTPLIEKDSKLKELVIDGKNIATLEAIGQGVGSLSAANGATLVFKNLIIKDSSESYAENSWELGYLEFGGKLVFENCSFVNAIMLTNDNGVYPDMNVEFKDCTFNANADNQYSVWVSQGTVSFKECAFAGARALKLHEAYGSKIDNVIIDDCLFEKLTKKPGIVIGTLDGTKVDILNNKFLQCQPGDAKDDASHGVPYILETDTKVENFKLTLKNNLVCTGHDNDASTMEHVAATKPTFDETGNIEYWICLCGKWFADAQGKQEIKDHSSVIIPKLKMDVEVNVPDVDISKPVDKVKPIIKNETINSTLEEAKDIVKDITAGVLTSQVSDETKKKVKDALDNGKTVNTEIIIETVKETDTSIKDDLVKVKEILATDKVKKEIGEVNISQLLNIELVLKTDNQVLGNINEVKRELSFNIAIPENLKMKDRTFYIVRVHNGEVEFLPTTVNKDGTLTFKTDRFSTYALTYVDKDEDKENITPPSTDKPTDKPSDTSKPNTETNSETKKDVINTGDETNISLYVSLCGLAIVGIAIISLNKKREELLNK